MMISMESYDLKQKKRSVRRELLKMRRELDHNTAAINSSMICSRIIHMSEYINAPIIFGYMPAKGEVDIIPILENALSIGKEIALPRCLDKEGHMEFCRISSYNDLVSGAFGILEPKAELCAAQVNRGLMLVPGVGFDEKCFRIGFGGGYYDRYIGFSKDVSYIAPAFELQIVATLPVEAHDRHVDKVVTEKRIISYEGGNIDD